MGRDFPLLPERESRLAKALVSLFPTASGSAKLLRLFFADGVGDSSGVGVGEALCLFFVDGVGDSSGVGVGEVLCFFFADGLADSSGVGVGDVLSFFFVTGVGDSSGVGVGEAFLRCFGEAEGLGLEVLDEVVLGKCFALGVVDGLGDGDAAFFFVDVVLRCLCGAGVGVGSKIFLILSPSDSSAASLTTGRAKTQMAAIKKSNRGPSFMGA